MMTWKNVRLGDVLNQRKQSILIDDQHEYKRCRVQVNRKGVVLRDIVKGLEINTKKQQICQTGDFIVAEIDAKVGGYGFISEELAGAIVSSHYYLYQVNQDKMLPAYLAHLIQTDIIQDQISAKGSTNYSSIRSHEVLSFEIPLPPLSEQAEFIGQLDRALNSTLGVAALLDRQLSMLANLRQSILREAVQGQLTTRWRQQNVTTEAGTDLLKRIRAYKQQLIIQGKLKKEKPLPPITSAETPFELPDGWVWCRLGDVVICERGRFSIRPRNDPSYFKGPYPFIQIGDLPDNGETIINHTQTLNEKGLKVSKMFPAGTIAIAIVGATIGNTGILGYDMCFTDSVVGIKPNELYDSSFINLCLRNNKGHYRILSYAGGGQPNIKLPTLNSTMIALPSLKEQQAVVERVAGMFGKIDALAERLNTARQVAGRLRQAVLREAFSPQSETVASTA